MTMSVLRRRSIMAVDRQTGRQLYRERAAAPRSDPAIDPADAAV
jgi:hypothetical protein